MAPAATIDGHVISAAEVKREIDSKPDLALLQQGKKRSENGRDAYEEAVHRLIDRFLLVREAKKLGVDEHRVQKFVKHTVEAYGGADPLASLLRDINSDFKTFTEQIADDKRVELLLDQQCNGKLEPSRSEVAAEFNAHPDRYKQKETVTLDHILIKAAQGATAEEIARAEQRATAVYRMAREKPRDFQKLVKQYSEAPLAKQGGHLGTFIHGTLLPEFEDVVFALKKGAVTAPVRTRFGFHILKVVAHTPAKALTLGEAKEEIEERLMREKKRACRERVVGGLREKSKITIAPPARAKGTTPAL